MEKDWLESYIEAKRSDFYQEEAPVDLWSKIEKKIPKEGKGSRMIFFPILLQVAAAVTLILCVGIGIGYYISGSTQINENPEIAEYLKSEPYFQQLVGHKLEAVSQMDGNTQSLKTEIDQLDARYQELKYELLHNPNANQDILIKSLIQNFQIRITLLEKIIQIKSAKNLQEDEQDRISI